MPPISASTTAAGVSSTPRWRAIADATRRDAACTSGFEIAGSPRSTVSGTSPGAARRVTDRRAAWATVAASAASSGGAVAQRESMRASAARRHASGSALRHDRANAQLRPVVASSSQKSPRSGP